MPENFIHRHIPGQPDRPVLLLLHGTGGNENDLLDLGHSLLPSAALLSPRGMILENGMPRFFRRLAEGVFDEEDLIYRTHELADFVETAQTEYQLAKRPIVAVGYSNGANIAASLLLLRPEILQGAVLLRAMVPLIPPKLPDLTRTAVFLAGGKTDRMIAPENTSELAALLERAGADVTLHWSEGGHELCSAEMAGTKQWLNDRFPAA
jgi:predicted esterase